jgi:selenocysteine-specific elongation factor
MTLLCTAGHVDHGKSALVKALTGTDPDRLAEERRRGMTIELGFVLWRRPSGFLVSIIDVPGHRRLIRTMASGAHAVDGVLLVVSAPEGVMPQTREHMSICQLFGPRPVIGVVSMTDRSDSSVVAERISEVGELVREAGGELLGVIACSAVTGQGLDELGALVESHFGSTILEPRNGEPRLHVDRAFVMKGRGLVVTGTLLDGPIHKKEAVRLLPEGLEARIHQIERHGGELQLALPGARTALNLHGVAAESVGRGQTVVRSGSLQAGTQFGVRIQLLPGTDLEARESNHVMLHHGTRCCVAQVNFLGKRSAPKGALGLAELKTSIPIVAIPGDRFLLRSTSSDVTLGGGIILDLSPARSHGSSASRIANLEQRGRGEPEHVLLAELNRAPEGLPLDELRQLTGLSLAGLSALSERLATEGRLRRPDGGRLLSIPAAAAVRQTIVQAVENYHRLSPSMRGITISELSQQIRHPLVASVVEQLIASGDLSIPVRGAVARPGWNPDTGKRAELLSWLERRGLEPATGHAMRDSGFGEEALRSLARDRQAIHLGMGFVAQSVVDNAARAVVRFVKEHGASSTGDLCRAMGTSRRTGIPVLEHLDAKGVTKRLGDKRTAIWRKREGNDPSEDAVSTPPSRFEDGGAHLDPSASG